MCALLNKQSHANHSFQLYIFDCSCTVIVTQSAALTAGTAVLLHVCGAE
jgi:hypothetical protein